MARLRITAAARRDLRGIAERGAEDHGVAASSKHMEGFRRLFRLLRERPLAGQERPEIGPDLRSLSHRPHRLIYRIDGDTVVIERVIHQARDVARSIEDDA